MSHLRILSFKYNLSKLPFKPMRRLSFQDRQSSDLSLTFEPDDYEMRQVFDKISGGAGKISTKNLKSLLLVTLRNADDACCLARKMMWAADANEDGFIDYNEFLEVHKRGVRMSEIREAFNMFDRDRDGRITAEELRDMMVSLGESCSLKQCDRMVKEVDRDGDGLDLQDFRAMMTRPRKKQ